MSVQRPVDLSLAQKVPATPDLIYFTAAVQKPAPVALSPLSAIDEMYAYYGSDRA